MTDTFALQLIVKVRTGLLHSAHRQGLFPKECDKCALLIAETAMSCGLSGKAQTQRHFRSIGVEASL